MRIGNIQGVRNKPEQKMKQKNNQKPLGDRGVQVLGQVSKKR